MAAAGGFWAKGAFFGPAEVALMQIATFKSAPSQDAAGYKAMLSGYNAHFSPQDIKSMIHHTLAYFGDDTIGFSQKKQTWVQKVGEKKAQEMMGAAVSSEDAKLAVNNQGIPFSVGEVKKLAEANGMTYTQMVAKLSGYKSLPTLKKWQAAAQGDGKLAQTAPATKKAAGEAPAVNFGDNKYSQAHAWGAQEYKTWTQGLSSQELSAFKTYTTPYYHTLSKVLREEGYNPNAFPNSKASQTIGGLDSALSKATLPADTVVYRGANGAMWQGLKPGDSWDDKGFLSTSLVGGYAKKWAYEHQHRGAPAIMEIRVKKGQNGAYLGAGASSAGSMEYELLMPRNATYTILKASTVVVKGKTMPYYVVEVQQ